MAIAASYADSGIRKLAVRDSLIYLFLLCVLLSEKEMGYWIKFSFYLTSVQVCKKLLLPEVKFLNGRCWIDYKSYQKNYLSVNLLLISRT